MDASTEYADHILVQASLTRTALKHEDLYGSLPALKQPSASQTDTGVDIATRI